MPWGRHRSDLRCRLMRAVAAAKCPAVTYTAVSPLRTDADHVEPRDCRTRCGRRIRSRTPGKASSCSTAVAGSIVDGAAAQAWTVTVTDAAGAANGAVTLRWQRPSPSTIDIPAGGLTQQPLAAFVFQPGMLSGTALRCSPQRLPTSVRRLCWLRRPWPDLRSSALRPVVPRTRR